jgi:hypothetical protein
MPAPCLCRTSPKQWFRSKRLYFCRYVSASANYLCCTPHCTLAYTDDLNVSCTEHQIQPVQSINQNVNEQCWRNWLAQDSLTLCACWKEYVHYVGMKLKTGRVFSARRTAFISISMSEISHRPSGARLTSCYALQCACVTKDHYIATLQQAHHFSQLLPLLVFES